MNALNVAFVFRRDVEVMLDVRIEIMMLTDSKKIFDAVTCGKRTE